MEGTVGTPFDCEADAEVTPVEVDGGDDDEEEKPDDYEDEEKPDEYEDEEKPDDYEDEEKPEDEGGDKPPISGDDGKWTKCDELEEVAGGFIECAIDVCTLTCEDGSNPVGPPKTKCLKIFLNEIYEFFQASHRVFVHIFEYVFWYVANNRLI